MMNPRYTLLLCAAALAGCVGSGVPDVTRFTEAAPIQTRTTPPPGSDMSACYGVDATPAVVETVSEQILLHPAELAADGTVLYPAVYKTETRQAIVRERREVWFETPCEADLTPDFIASLQRALQVRGLYGGPVNGELNSRTRAAVRTFQKPQGLDSAILSMAGARQLGLVAYGRPGAGG